MLSRESNISCLGQGDQLIHWCYIRSSPQ